MTFGQLKVGDILARENDHFGRHDDRITIVGIKRGNPTKYILAGYWRSDEYATALSSQNYTTVYRDGKPIGTVFAKYW